MGAAHRSSAWSESVATGHRYTVAGQTCRLCKCDAPAYYFREPGICWDCRIRRRDNPRRHRLPRIPENLPPRRHHHLPLLSQAEIANLPLAQRAAYAGIAAGLSLRKIAEKSGIAHSSVAAALRRLRERGATTRRIDRGGALPPSSAPHAVRGSEHGRTANDRTGGGAAA